MTSPRAHSRLEKSSRDFSLRGKDSCGILELVPSSKNQPFYYFSTTFGGTDLPYFAAFCEVMKMGHSEMTRFDITETV